MKARIQILIALLIVAKILAGSVFYYRMGITSQSTANASELQESEKIIEREAKGFNASDNFDLSFIAKRKSELEAEAKKIEKRKAELVAIQDDISRKIEQLTVLRNEIKAEVDNKKTAQEQKLKHLIKAYTAMTPQNAAKLMEKLDLTFAIELLSNMKGDVVGSILSFLSVERAALISEGLVKRE
jgi:flagellar motility protein MotE (MotC chaperone)